LKVSSYIPFLLTKWPLNEFVYQLELQPLNEVGEHVEKGAS